MLEVTDDEVTAPITANTAQSGGFRRCPFGGSWRRRPSPGAAAKRLDAWETREKQRGMQLLSQ
jgi:hypothetical protein